MVGGVLSVLPPAIDPPIFDLMTAVSAPLIEPLAPISQRKLDPSTVAPTCALQMFTSEPVTDPLAFTSPRSVRKLTVAEASDSEPALVTFETVRAIACASASP